MKIVIALSKLKNEEINPLKVLKAVYKFKFTQKQVFKITLGTEEYL